MKLTQVDMSRDISKQTEVMKCIAGYFIGNSSNAGPVNPVIQKSILYAIAAETETAFESGQ